MRSGIPQVLAAAVLLCAAAGIVVPAPSRGLLPVAVGAPELSSWLLVAAVLIALLTLPTRGPIRITTCALTLLAGTLTLLPLIRIPAAGRQADDALRATFGAGYLDRLDPAARARLRPAAVRVFELFRGIAIGPPVQISDIPYASPGGQGLTMRVYRPSTTPAAVVLQFYGGAWQRGVPADDPVMASYLASRGYLVCAADYRHAPSWPWPAQLEDVRAALDWVRAHAHEYGGDAARIAVIGRSAGGHLALIGGYAAGAPGVRSVVSLYGPTDLARGYRELPRPDPIGVRATLEALIGATPGAAPERYRDASPATYAAGRVPPTLQIIGLRDHVVLPRFASSLDASLRAAGNQSVLITLPWAEHAFDAISFGPSAQIALYATERFLAVTLLGDARSTGPAPGESRP